MLSGCPDLGEAGRSEGCPVIGRTDACGEVVARALAEPGCAEHGGGAVIPGYGQVSMVFDHPDKWGMGLAATSCMRSTSVHRHAAGAI